MNSPLIVVFTLSDDDTKAGYLNQLLGEAELQWLWEDDDRSPVLISGDGCRIFNPAAEEPRQARVDVVLFYDGEYDAANDANWIDTVASPMFLELGVQGRPLGVVLHDSSSDHGTQLAMLKKATGEISPASLLREHHNSGAVFRQLCTIAKSVEKMDHSGYEAAFQPLIQLVLRDPQFEVKLNLLHALLLPRGDGADPPQWATLERELGGNPEFMAVRAAWNEFRSAYHIAANSIAGSDVTEALHAYWDPEGPLAAFRDALLGAEP